MWGMHAAGAALGPTVVSASLKENASLKEKRIRHLYGLDFVKARPGRNNFSGVKPAESWAVCQICQNGLSPV